MSFFLFNKKKKKQGGIQEQFDLRKLSSTDRANFWTYLEKGYAKDALLGCSINVNISDGKKNNLACLNLSNK